MRPAVSLFLSETGVCVPVSTTLALNWVLTTSLVCDPIVSTTLYLKHLYISLVTLSSLLEKTPSHILRLLHSYQS
ncbi:hypothetical protein CAAN1_26S00210 [[Candida] anglica]|uniref:Uncharacterized protein n=1 Tax=[Candida] anglica TaxID=148631 RepID=A0ABP0EHG9_9ASCO